MSPRDTDDDLPHDAWLREALRHAPDAEAGPPPKLNETILRMGRAAVAPRAERRPTPAVPRPTASSSRGLAEMISSCWAWLARPPVAAGFAGLMVATVVGVMWWDRPLEEALPPREESVAAAPSPSPAAAPAAVTTPVPAGLPDAAKRAAAPAANDTAWRKAVPAATAPPAAPAVTAKAEAPPPAAAPAPVPTPTPAPAQTPAPPVVAESTAREREAAERRDVAASRMAAATAPAADAAVPGALSGRAAALATPAAAAASGIETPSLSNLRFEIRRQPDAWTWQRDDGEVRAMDEAMQNWIAQADRTSRPSWQVGATGADSSTTTLRFTRGGVVRAVLRLGPSGMRLTRGGKTESVELSRGAMASLQAALDGLGP
jgi:hypothetical protein